ncbi:MAG: hypothetical protein FWH00_02565 [Oscillospiraceae bacterium]|nr:hypothetical protein [Oscillospiraceae bacterium]
MVTNIAALTRYSVKGAPGETLSEMTLIEGLGIEGDFHRGGDKQISILSAEVRRWMEAQPKPGLCFMRFRENILLDGLDMRTLKPGGLLSVGTAVLKITKRGKRCFDECGLFTGGGSCRLSECAVFAAVEKGGIIRVGDLASML